MSLELASGWRVDLERGPDWLYVRPLPPADQAASIDLADAVWQVLEQEFTYRLVLELDELPVLHSELLGSLVRLSRRIYAHHGMFRICGLSERNVESLRLSRLAGQVSHYASREEAVMGHRPAQPR